MYLGTLFLNLVYIPIICSIFLTFYSYTKREVKGAYSFAFYMLFRCFFTIATALELQSLTIEYKLLFRNIEQIGMLFSSVAFLFLSLDFSGYERYITKKNIIYVSIIPIITLLLIFTDDYHHLMRSQVYLNHAFDPNSLIVKRTLLSTYFYYYIKLTTAIAMVVLLKHYKNLQKLYRPQVVAIISCGLFPFILSMLKATVLSNVGNYFPLAISTIPVDFIMFWTIFRNNLFSIWPIARNKIIEEMKEGILIIDNNENIVDINDATIKIFNEAFGITKDFIVKQKVSTLLKHWEPWLESLSHHKETELEITIPSDSPLKYYKVKVSPILSDKGTIIGHLCILNDITASKLYEEQLTFKANIDGLTLINNKRYYSELSEHYLLNSKLKPISIIVMDIDFFKRVNDTYGHSIGDKALIHVVNICNCLIRETDVMGRIGGEEFAITLLNTDCEEAFNIAERIRASIEYAPLVTKEGYTLNLTVSIGIASTFKEKNTLEELLIEADKALYEAKNSGRNCIKQNQPLLLG